MRKIRLKFTLRQFFVLIPYFKFTRDLPVFDFEWIVTFKFLFFMIELFKEK